MHHGARRATLVAVVVLLSALFWSGGAGAQGLAGCEPRRASDPPRTIVDCGGTLLEWEAAADLGIVPRDQGGTVLLQQGAALIETAAEGQDFQIRTPHAIASVRGTVFAVDVSEGETAVFVSEGRVWVQKIGTAESVVLSAGQGVDVAPAAPLVVRRWGDQRVADLLARFGR